ncbi:enoyl-CoA hydratase/isomerase family protein [Nocardia gipuzkoensis]|uniref:enoyl-CoA hydratase/isomerase family protein n=1 Tax=Nocardia gipuzkoensis TaxID=2749991 RepID=UPI00237E2509|nr:enoyl-CoA hydratase/isomerase family protein [Nocardia gipuzkoensis]MDE1675266.1 enoyl-CoA hydratase/isomerase family protein [Nocardia gipuzkoensis]
MSVDYYFERSVAEIVLNRPDKLNALDPSSTDAIIEGLDRAVTDGARAVLIRAVGRAFCSGRDLSSVSVNEDAVGLLKSVFNRLVLRIHDLAIPTVAAVQGACMGAGAGIALACDLTVASEDAVFGSPFGRLGAVPDSGFHWFITTRLGPALARDLILSGRILDGHEAAKLGLVARCVARPELDNEARKLAYTVAAGPITAFQLSMALVDDVAAGASLAAALDAEATAQGVAYASPDVAEGLAAFAEKRAPRFMAGDHH